jgi:MerR family transcriptional regulator, light-induced transcriptional regulator
MVSINEFSDDPRYNIKAVTQKTDIQSVTLRAWERRYGLLTPKRAENGYRLYSERDIAILLWVKSRVDSGISISSAAGELQQLTGAEMWPEAVISNKGPIPSHMGTKLTAETAIRQLSLALVHHDENMANRIFADILGSFDLENLFESVLFPILVDIGDRWALGEIKVATEHFASGFILAKLQAIFQTLPQRTSSPRLMVGCAPEELHQIGPLMFAILLRNAGYRVEFLGPDVPLDDLAAYVAEENPRMLILSATLKSSAEDLAAFPAKLAKIKQPPLFGFGGAAFNYHQEMTTQIKGIYLGRTLKQSLDAVKKAVELKPAKPKPN